MSNLTFAKCPEMEGFKFAVYVKSEDVVYASPAIYKLCMEDLEIMKKNLRIQFMPTNPDGSNQFESAAEYAIHLRGNCEHAGSE